MATLTAASPLFRPQRIEPTMRLRIAILLTAAAHLMVTGGSLVVIFGLTLILGENHPGYWLAMGLWWMLCFPLMTLESIGVSLLSADVGAAGQGIIFIANSLCWAAIACPLWRRLSPRARRWLAQKSGRRIRFVKRAAAALLAGVVGLCIGYAAVAFTIAEHGSSAGGIEEVELSILGVTVHRESGPYDEVFPDDARRYWYVIVPRWSAAIGALCGFGIGILIQRHLARVITVDDPKRTAVERKQRPRPVG
jgi:hypothetical protein